MELTLDQALKNGIEAHKAGKVQEADRYYTTILITQPNHSHANHNMGVLAVGAGKVQEALPFLKALETNSGIDQFWLSYINALIKLNLLADAKVILDKAKSKGLKGDVFEQIDKRLVSLQKGIEVNIALNELKEPTEKQLKNLINLYNKGLFQKALAKGLKLLTDFPNSMNLLNIMGVINRDLGKLDEAIEVFNKALSINPNYADAYFNMGTALQKQSKLDQAIEAYNKALLHNPNYAEAYYNIGIALQKQGNLDKAIEPFKKAISLKPDFSKAYNNMGFTLQKQGKLDKAKVFLKKAISLKPDYVDAHNNMGNVLQESGETIEAIQAYKKSIFYRPDFAKAHKNLSFALLNHGSYQEGLDEYEWRWKTDEFLTNYRYFSQPLWKKETNLNGKTILIWCEQGVGDTINWSSCISYIASKANHCILECQEKLVPLLKRSFPNIEVKAEDRNLDTERNDFDYHLPMGSLYKNLNINIFQKTKVDAYLIPDLERVKYWRKRLNSIGKGLLLE